MKIMTAELIDIDNLFLSRDKNADIFKESYSITRLSYTIRNLFTVLDGMMD